MGLWNSVSANIRFVQNAWVGKRYYEAKVQKYDFI